MSDPRDRDRPFAVVGGGIAGVACAQALQAAGLPVVVYDRGRRIGGRMAVREVDGHVVDIGASYFTVPEGDDAFAAVVAGWEERGLARRWTDTFHVAEGGTLTGTKAGPLRWAGTAGLRPLVDDLARGLVVEQGVEVEDVGPGPSVDGTPVRAAVLAMPGPQAADLMSDELDGAVEAAASTDWEPCLALYAGWSERSWTEVDGVFVNGSPVLDWVADDGRRRGDGAPVLVAHSTAALAADHLDDPDAAVPALLGALCDLLEVGREPSWVKVRRWSLARPARAREEPWFLSDVGVGLCGDGWNAPSRVAGAYGSGRLLGEELARRYG
ncbi:NAD(P)/FAD-dependent oxidoreductase [Vallicoccus soli]|uniref:NAD/FAD-dependent oxidoreductase n=1 Tax=Vallicoccus soli TaxID=2339232 RepID=A0A3A3YUA1_9ACTN|nr:FAD-dependent oxidoreductase [Vallicoccus soli]RJK94303.1 NAD/FAD-dependent oxidoreductase [Vallicoccus soli]